MPIPLLIWCVAGVIAAVVAIKKGFFKKKVFIYGMKATGKTTFHKYCTTGNIIKEYFPTGTGEFDKKAILDKTKAKWKEWIGGWTIIDSAGQDYTNRELTEIKGYIEEASIVLYFFRADEIANPADRKRVLRTIKANIMQYKQQELSEKLILVATHTDLIASFSPKMAVQDWEKEPVLKDVLRLSRKHRIEYVSLTPRQIESSAKHILDLIKEKN